VFKIKNKFLVYITASVFFLFLFSCLIPVIRPSASGTLRQPLKLLALLRREIGGIIFYHRNLIQKERLKNENGLLRQKIISLNEIYLENGRLKKALSLKQDSPYKVIASRVIGRSADSWVSAIIIDKGSSHGIKRGMPVITYSGLLGCISETAKFTSKVLLISDPGFAVSGIVQRSRQEGLIAGTLGAHLIMRYLPEEPDIQVSDTIITSGLNSLYPKGLLIGTVIDIGKEFSGLSRYALVKPAANLSNIEEVLIIIQQ
jgi:rod shape-determining protein MreC